MAPVQYGSVGSKSVQVGSVGTARAVGNARWTLDVVTRLSLLSRALVLGRFKPQAFDHREMLPVPTDERTTLLDRGGRDQ